MNKYQVSVNLNLVVETKDRKNCRKEVNDFPWNDLICLDYPKTGFIKEVSIRVGAPAA